MAEIPEILPGWQRCRMGEGLDGDWNAAQLTLGTRLCTIPDLAEHPRVLKPKLRLPSKKEVVEFRLC